MQSYTCCSVCREAHFTNSMALNRHENVCRAMRNIFGGAGFETPSDSNGPHPLESSLLFNSPHGTQPSTASTSNTAPSVSSALPSTSAFTDTHTPLDLTKAAFVAPSSARLPSPTYMHSPLDLTKKRTTTTAQGPNKRPVRKTLQTSTIPLNLHPLPGPSTSRYFYKNSNASTSADVTHTTHTPTITTGQGTSLTWSKRKALKHARDYVIQNNGVHTGLAAFLDEAMVIVKERLITELTEYSTLKYNLVLEARYAHPDDVTEDFNFKTRNKMLFFDSTEHLDSILRKNSQKLLAEEGVVETKNSGWFLELPLTLTLRVSLLSLRKPSGSSYVKLPYKLHRRNATINIQNTDNKCFLYSVLAKHLPTAHSNSILTEHSFRDLLEHYNLDGLKFPTKVSTIRKFERNNPGCSVNVFECGPEGIITPYKVVDRELDDHTDLLLYTPKTGTPHYVYITDFSKLIQPQVTKGGNRIVVCKRCTTYKEARRCNPDAETWLKEHMYYCAKNRPTRIALPDDSESILKFENFENLVPVPIICAADFEASLLPTVRTDNAYQLHEANSFSVLIHSELPEEVLADVGISTSLEIHMSDNAGADLLLYLRELAENVESLYTRNVPMRQLTDAEIHKHLHTTSCELCGQPFDAQNQGQSKTFDHCHITGEPRRTICNRCNLRCRQVNYIPIYMHNFSGYDCNFLLQNLHVLKGHEIRTVPANSSRLISVMVRIGKIWLRFLDSYRLMDSSLADLVKNLSPSELVKSSKLVPPEHLDLITRKGVYPYDYVTGKHVFAETSLPPKEAFYNKLNDEAISDADYQHALYVWDKLEMKTFADFHKHYLSLDTSLLLDLLLSFRKRCLETYKVDCCRYFTAPGLAFSAMLLTTRVELELITDPDQLYLVESGIRGGIVQCPLRYARANNTRLEDVPTDYRPDEPESHLFYWDCTNLYGYAMSQPLPTGNFKWEEPDSTDWFTRPANAPRGLILECDVTVPTDVHDRLEQLPPLAEVQCPPGSRHKKLMTTLHDKTRYVAHYTVFQQAVKLGLKVTKVHKVLSFSQSCWMKGFIEMNAELRANSSDAFSRSFYKLMNNAVFGKTMENVRKRQDIRIVTTPEQLEKQVRKTRFLEHTIISEDVVVVRLAKEKVLMNKPVYIGMCVLDISKVHMYDYLYNTVFSHFTASEGHKVELAYIDTDGILVKITTPPREDVFRILRQPSFYSRLDQTVYPVDHPLRGDENKGRLGAFKDECSGREVYELIALRPKMYAYRFSSTNTDPTLKAKGIKTGYVRRNIVYQNYRDILFGKTQMEKARYNLIQRKSFQLTSATVTKKSLSAEDDKRFTLDDGIHTLPWGHYAIRDSQLEQQNNTEEDSDSSTSNDSDTD